MGTWSVRTDISETSDQENAIYAPSLIGLPDGYPVVMATLPVVNWNAELTAALLADAPVSGPRIYAALLMVDPFTLWEDMADLLRDKGIAGVVNFPPASLLEGATTLGAGTSENTLEMDRLKWFSEAGFHLVYAASGLDEIVATSSRLGGLVDAFLHLPPTVLDLKLSKTIVLEKTDLSALPELTYLTVLTPNGL